MWNPNTLNRFKNTVFYSFYPQRIYISHNSIWCRKYFKILLQAFMFPIMHSEKLFMNSKFSKINTCNLKSSWLNLPSCDRSGRPHAVLSAPSHPQHRRHWHVVQGHGVVLSAHSQPASVSVQPVSYLTFVQGVFHKNSR